MTVGAWNDRNFGHNVRFGERKNFFFENAVELFCSVARILDMLLLVLSHGNDSCVVEQNIGGHEHWVIERTNIELLALCFCVFVRVRAHEVRHRRDGVENPTELCVCGHIGLFEKYHFFWIKSDGNVGHDEFTRTAAHVFGILHRIECMVVGDENEGLVVARVSERYLLAHSTKIVADVEVASGFYARDENWFFTLHMASRYHVDYWVCTGCSNTS